MNTPRHAATAYDTLIARFRRISLIDDTLGILDWDQATVMPEGSADARAEQLAALAVMRHELLTDPVVADLIADASGLASAEPDAGDDWCAENLRLMQARHDHATAVPASLVEAQARADAVCEIRWRRAREDADFAGLLPALSDVLHLVREGAAAKAQALGVSPYDALLDQYERGLRSERIDDIFADLASFLPDFLPEVLERQAARPAPQSPEGPFAIPVQRELCVTLMQALGFDFERGRLDVSHHPFCGGSTGDVRITTRYSEDDFTSSLMGVLHETGHALYELGRPADRLHQPVGDALGMMIHESQSLLVEMQVSRSRPFLDYAAPLMRAAFGASGPAWEAENLYRLYTRVEPGFIRVDADEVTYPAHIILRYRLERALLSGDLPLEDLPSAWNDGMRELLGIVPPDDRLGCLQDIHWPSGAFGYFPTYTLGAMAAAQLYAALRRDRPMIEDEIRSGDLRGLVDWLHARVHGQGSRHTAGELLERVTGDDLDPEVFKAHLRRRYLGD